MVPRLSFQEVFLGLKLGYGRPPALTVCLWPSRGCPPPSASWPRRQPRVIGTPYRTAQRDRRVSYASSGMR
jgi:hypothetical protein